MQLVKNFDKYARPLGSADSIPYLADYTLPLVDLLENLLVDLVKSSAEGYTAFVIRLLLLLDVLSVDDTDRQLMP
uniref:Uncharacterized protein n=1 Tax=Acrobeloides nanus TaxID=290746 RepID=A0A914E449_9BILA